MASTPTTSRRTPSRPSPFPQDEIALVFTGAMDYWPNVDAVCWFVREVLPKLVRAWPTLRFHIVGRKPTAAVQALVLADSQRHRDGTRCAAIPAACGCRGCAAAVGARNSEQGARSDGDGPPRRRFGAVCRGDGRQRGGPTSSLRAKPTTSCAKSRRCCSLRSARRRWVAPDGNACCSATAGMHTWRASSAIWAWERSHERAHGRSEAGARECAGCTDERSACPGCRRLGGRH